MMGVNQARILALVFQATKAQRLLGRALGRSSPKGCQAGASSGRGRRDSSQEIEEWVGLPRQICRVQLKQSTMASAGAAAATAAAGGQLMLQKWLRRPDRWREVQRHSPTAATRSFHLHGFRSHVAMLALCSAAICQQSTVMWQCRRGLARRPQGGQRD